MEKRTVERLSWIAGIVSGAIAVAGVGWTAWAYYEQKSEQKAAEERSAIQMEKFKQGSVRQKKFMDAYEATFFAQRSAKKILNERERKIYAQADQEFSKARHLGQLDGKGEEALQSYKRAQELFEQLKASP